MRYEYLLSQAKRLRAIDGSIRGLQRARETLLASLAGYERETVIGAASVRPPRKRKPSTRRSVAEAARNRKSTKTESDYRRNFWGLVAKQPDGCWLWTGSKAQPKRGAAPRGRFYYLGKTWSAHRLAFLLHNNVDPGESCVLHSCDVSLCVNPDHLSLGSQQDNVADMDRKGRRVPPQGERNRSAKLTAANVVELRRRHANGESIAELALAFVLDRASVRLIVKRINWRHVA
jgi:hypothetical protein